MVYIQIVADSTQGIEETNHHFPTRKNQTINCATRYSVPCLNQNPDRFYVSFTVPKKQVQSSICSRPNKAYQNTQRPKTKNSRHRFVVSFISSFKTLLPLQLFGTARRAKHHHHATGDLPGEDLPVLEAALALGAAEAVLVPLAAQRLDVLTDDGGPALPTLGSPPLGTLGLTLNAPRVAVLLDVGHAVLERVAALGAEEVPIVPVVAQRHNVLAENGRPAVLAPRGEELVPVEMAVEPETIVSVLRHGHAWGLVQDFAGSPALDADKTLTADPIRLWADLHGFESGTAGEAAQTLWVETLGAARQSYKPALNGVPALMTDCPPQAGCSRGSRPVTLRPGGSLGSLHPSTPGRTRALWGAGGLIIWGDNGGDVAAARRAVNSD